MRNGKNYKIKFSKQAQKDKIKLKNAGLGETSRIILSFMENDPFCFPPEYEKI